MQDLTTDPSLHLAKPFQVEATTNKRHRRVRSH